MHKSKAKPGPVVSAYEALIASGAAVDDIHQREALAKLEQLAAHLNRPIVNQGGIFRRLRKAPPEIIPAKGIYIWGPVGTGKSMLMDIFFTSVKCTRLKTHFHQFMKSVHEHMHALQARGAGKSEAEDPLKPIAAEISTKYQLICFDEFLVEHIGDAMILKRLFDLLINAGTTLVATSNTAPENLYYNGLNRILFLPFIDLVHAKLDVISLTDKVDYRRHNLSREELYLWPLDAQSKKRLLLIWDKLTQNELDEAPSIKVGRRQVEAKRKNNRFVWFDFASLCEQPLGASFYLDLLEKLDCLFLDNVPAFDSMAQSAGIRFVHLIDALYAQSKALIVRAEQEPTTMPHLDARIPGFSRTLSRLAEMRSGSYFDTILPQQLPPPE